MANLLFRGEDVDKHVGVLSAGEMVRVALAKLLVGRYNLLILDEPTNHLDVKAREAVERALADYEGTIPAASHDRYFVGRIASEIWLLAPQAGGVGSASSLRVLRRGLEEYVGRGGGEMGGGGVGSASSAVGSGRNDIDDGQRLLLESRLAQLGGLLAQKALSDDRRAAPQAEYLERRPKRWPPWPPWLRAGRRECPRGDPRQAGIGARGGEPYQTSNGLDQSLEFYHLST